MDANVYIHFFDLPLEKHLLLGELVLLELQRSQLLLGAGHVERIHIAFQCLILLLLHHEILLLLLQLHLLNIPTLCTLHMSTHCLLLHCLLPGSLHSIAR